MNRFLTKAMCIVFILCLTASGEESEMKLFINDVEIPVIWEENDSVAELMEEASKGDIIILMSMYSDFEQVGSLGKKYRSNDKQMTVHNEDRENCSKGSFALCKSKMV